MPVLPYRWMPRQSRVSRGQRYVSRRSPGPGFALACCTQGERDMPPMTPSCGASGPRWWGRERWPTCCASPPPPTASGPSAVRSTCRCCCGRGWSNVKGMRSWFIPGFRPWRRATCPASAPACEPSTSAPPVPDGRSTRSPLSNTCHSSRRPDHRHTRRREPSIPPQGVAEPLLATSAPGGAI